MGGKTRAKQEQEKIHNDRHLPAFKKVGSKTDTTQLTISDARRLLNSWSNQAVQDIQTFIQFKTKSKDNDKRLMEVVKFAFNKYPVNHNLAKAWYLNEQKIDSSFHPTIRFKTEHHRYRDWYVCVATGGSLYKQYLKDYLTKKEVHSFLNCRIDMSINESLYWAIAISNGGTDSVARKIAISKLSTHEVTQSFWVESARVLATMPIQSTDQVDDIYDYLRAKKDGDLTFTIKGKSLTLDALIHRVEQWHRDLSRMKVIGNSTWTGHPIDNVSYTVEENNQKRIWYFDQILTSKSLQQEGNQQRHCVFGYLHKCQKGTASIWSLQLENEYGSRKRKVTIELDDSMTIVQARGLANRKITNQEMAIINKWANSNGLKISYRMW